MLAPDKSQYRQLYLREAKRIYPGGDYEFHALRFTSYRSEVRGRLAMPCCGLKGRRDAEEHRFVKRACNEVDADGQVGRYGANQARAAIGIAHSN